MGPIPVRLGNPKSHNTTSRNSTSAILLEPGPLWAVSHSKKVRSVACSHQLELHQIMLEFPTHQIMLEAPFHILKCQSPCTVSSEIIL
jgi:hypothetical protein